MERRMSGVVPAGCQLPRRPGESSSRLGRFHPATKKEPPALQLAGAPAESLTGKALARVRGLTKSAETYRVCSWQALPIAQHAIDLVQGAHPALPATGTADVVFGRIVSVLWGHPALHEGGGQKIGPAPPGIARWGNGCPVGSVRQHRLDRTDWRRAFDFRYCGADFLGGLDELDKAHGRELRTEQTPSPI